MKKYYTEGRLLERISYLSRKESKMTNLFGEEITVRETFPYNTESKTAPLTAKRWVSQRTWNYKTSSYDDDDYVPVVDDRSNDPFEVAIIDLHVRSEGGRAYKVIDGESRVFDLREDQLLEALKLGGVQPGGKINGKFVWGVLSSQVRMVYVGGEMHQNMVKKFETILLAEDMKASGGAPSAGSLKVGHVYKKRDESLHVFVGRVRMTGSKKKLFAFVELPAPPFRFSDDEFNNLIARYTTGGGYAHQDYLERLRRDQDIATRWDIMTWSDRFKSKCDQIYRAPEIVFMTTPKFDSEESDDLRDVVDMLRSNVDNRHAYLDGNRNDLVMSRWQKKTGVVLTNSWKFTQAWRIEQTKLAYDEFKAELVWD